VPFALDGAGGFYLFDMRNGPVNGEYPIATAHAGNLGWDDESAYAKCATTFAEAILSRRD
ncbi:MAG TPA: hypothetical protein VGM98_19930, partial [Schlesneria sp.]